MFHFKKLPCKYGSTENSTGSSGSASAASSSFEAVMLPLLLPLLPTLFLPPLPSALLSLLGWRFLRVLLPLAARLLFLAQSLP